MTETRQAVTVFLRDLFPPQDEMGSSDIQEVWGTWHAFAHSAAAFVLIEGSAEESDDRMGASGVLFIC